MLLYHLEEGKRIIAAYLGLCEVTLIDTSSLGPLPEPHFPNFQLEELDEITESESWALESSGLSTLNAGRNPAAASSASTPASGALFLIAESLRSPLGLTCCMFISNFPFLFSHL